MDSLRIMARLALVGLAGASLAACASVHPQYSAGGTAARPPASTPGAHGTMAPYQVGGIWYVPREQPSYNETGTASWYGDAFDQKPTADGEIFDKDLPSAAHTTLPLPSLVEVTNLDNGRRLVVRVNDRGPFVGGRIIDLSHEAARQLGYDRQGLAHVRVRYIGPAPLYGEDTRRYARYQPPRTPAPLEPKRSKPAPLTGGELPELPAASDVILAAGTAPKAAPVMIAELKPLPPAIRSAVPPPQPAVQQTVQAAPEPLPSYRVQAGAFASAENAQRAVSMLATTGRASVEPLARDGGTLWRVTLPAADEDQAEKLRQRVAEAGFPDARVIRPF